MKIFHIIHTKGVSGAEKHLLDLLPQLKVNNIDCELLCVSPKKNADILEEYCLEFRKKGVKATLFTTASKLSFIKTARAISKYLKANNGHILHSHLFNGDLMAVLVKKIFFPELVILSTKHGYEENYLIRYGLGNKKIPRNFYYVISRMIIKNIDHNLGVSGAISRMYNILKLGEPNFKYVHHGINIQPSAKNQVRTGGDPKILIVGRLVFIKGHTYLIRALPEVVKKFPLLKLIIIGEGRMRKELEQQAIRENVLQHIEFRGFDDPNKYIPQCKLMILPSIFESFGLVYIESFALKIPVIAFEAEAANEIIEDGVTGFLVPLKDSKALAGKIISLLESPEERKRVIANAYEKYVTYYTAGRMAKETAQWYHSVLTPRKE